MNRKFLAAGLGCSLVAALGVAGFAAASTNPLVAESSALQAEPGESSSPRPSDSRRSSSDEIDDDAATGQVAEPSAATEAPAVAAPADSAPAAPAPAAPAAPPPPPPPPPAPAPAPPAASTGAQQTVLNLVNERRAAAGVAPVAINGSLSQAAAVQAQYQAANLTMTHDGNGGLGARVSAAGYGYCWVGENVAAGQRDAYEVHNAWVNSPGHLANIISSRATEMGLASAVGSNGVIYWAEVFGARC